MTGMVKMMKVNHLKRELIGMFFLCLAFLQNLKVLFTLKNKGFLDYFELMKKNKNWG